MSAKKTVKREIRFHYLRKLKVLRPGRSSLLRLHLQTLCPPTPRWDRWALLVLVWASGSASVFLNWTAESSPHPEDIRFHDRRPSPVTFVLLHVHPYRSGLVGEGASTVQQHLADEEESQQCQQDRDTGNSYWAHHCHQQLVTVPSRPPSYSLSGRDQVLEACLAERKKCKS